MKEKLILSLKIALCLLLSTSVYAANNATFTYNWNDMGSTTKTLDLTENQGSQVHSFTTSHTFKLETGKTAELGQIVLTFPRYIFEDRLGTGYAQAQLTLPDAPEKVPADGSFYYYFSGNDLIITNIKTVTAGTIVSWDIQYSGSATNLPVSYSKILTAKCSVNGELLSPSPSLTLNITKTFDPGTAYSNISKSSSGKQNAWQDIWGIKPALPGGADAGYVYIVFNINLINTTGLLPGYVHYTETPEMSGVIVAWGKYTTTSQITYYQDDFNTNASYSPADIDTRRSVVVRYRISDLDTSGGNYRGYNNIEARYKLELGDEQIRSYRYQFCFQELGFNYQGDDFRISKGISGSLIMPKKLLGNENSDKLDFYLNAVSRGYSLTENGNTAYTMSYADDMIYLDGTRLTSADYFIEEMSLAFVTFPGVTGSNIVAYKQTNVNTATGQISDDADYANYPPVDVYTRNDDNNTWVKFGSYRICGSATGTFTPVSSSLAQPVTNTTKIALLPGVTQVKFDVATEAYQTTLGAWLHARLKPSATVKSILTNNPFATVENIATLIIRDKDGNLVNPSTPGSVSGSNKEAIIERDIALYGNIAQKTRANTSFFPRIPTMVQSAKYGPATATVDDLNQRYIADYSMYTANYSLLAASLEDFREATDEQKDGIFYDLLPVGMTVDINSIRAWCFDEKISSYNSAVYLTNANAVPVTVNTNFVENWRNSGRTMMKIHVTATVGNVIINKNGYPGSGFMVRYRAYYPYTAVKDYGTKARNSFMFLSNSGEIANIHYGKSSTFPPSYGFFDEQLAYDDMPIFSAYNYGLAEISKTEIDAGWWTDMNEDGNPEGRLFNTTMPTYEMLNTNFPSNPMASESGMIKKVKPSSSPMYSYNGIIWPNDTYNYQLRYSNSGAETTDNLIIYDKIESANGINLAFKGTLTGVNTIHPASKGINPVVYFSTDASIDLANSSHRDLSNGALWSTTAPTNLATVMAIAVDCTKKPDGTTYTLSENEAVVIEINMKAPDNFAAISGKKAYNTGVTTGISNLSGSFTDVTDPATELTTGTPFTVDLTGIVTLNGASTMDANQFQFRLSEDAGNNKANYSGITFTAGQSPIVLANGSGAFNLGTLSFTDAGTYTFTATEIASRVDGNNVGYIFDDKPVTVTIVVLKVENELTGSVTVTKNSADTEGVMFANYKIKAVNDAATTKPGVAIDIAVLDNDELLMGEDAYTVVVHGSLDELAGDQLTAPAQGTVTVKPDGKITYTPNNDTWEGIDVFEYQVYYSGSEVRSNKAVVCVLILDENAVTCDDTRTIQLNMPSGATFIWYNAAIGGTMLANNTAITVNRDDVNHYVDRWIAIDYKPDGSATSVYPERIKVRVRFVPTVMYWLGVNKNWNDPVNWSASKNGAAFDSELEFVPWPCIVVHIPDGAAIYPSLESPTTNHTIYNGRADKEPVCNEIYFEHGGEVVRTDLLHYNKAHVELTLEADRWNMLSAPLRYTFPGDYYKTDPCPHQDELRIYQQLFAMENPQTGQMEGGWTGAFNNPEIVMPAGFGYAIQLIDRSDYLNEGHWIPLPPGQRHSIWLPKNNEFYNIYKIYSSDGQGTPPYTGSCDVYQTRSLNRGNASDNYRFVYEGGDGWNTGSWTGDITLTTSVSSEAGWQVIVGNPFMAHWNFSDFYQQNSGKIKEEYYVLEGDDYTSFTPYSPLLPSWSTNKLIAPMQSVLVTSLTAFGETALKTRVTSMAQNPGSILKSSNSNMNANLLKIVATKNGKENQTHVLFDASASNNYLLNKDTYKLFVTGVTEAVSVYTRSADGYALDINVFGDCSEMIPVGIRTSQTGNISLQFEGIENFNEVFLLDTQNETKINLKETPGYSFEKTTSDLFMDGRFYLSFNKASDNALLPVQETISIFTAGNSLQVVSSNSNINEVQVFDMQGRLLHKAANVGSTAYSYDLERNRMYTVKVLTKEGVTVRKVITGK